MIGSRAPLFGPNCGVLVPLWTHLNNNDPRNFPSNCNLIEFFRSDGVLRTYILNRFPFADKDTRVEVGGNCGNEMWNCALMREQAKGIQLKNNSYINDSSVPGNE